MKASQRKSISLRHPLTFIFIFMTLVILAALLGSFIKKKALVADKSRPLIVLPEPPPLAEADSLALANSCAAWYDQILANSCFNGGVVIAKNGRIIFEKYKGQTDILFAGFPCQGFSTAGKKKDDDPRNTMFLEFLKIGRAHV